MGVKQKSNICGSDTSIYNLQYHILSNFTDIHEYQQNHSSSLNFFSQRRMYIENSNMQYFSRSEIQDYQNLILITDVPIKF